MLTIHSGNVAANNMSAMHSGMNTQADSVSKSIQSQIADAQKQLQALSENKEMTPEEKMKKRQEIQQEISSLNQQLRQHQIEKRKEQQTKKETADKESKSNNQRAGNAEPKTGLSSTSMQALLSAESSMDQARVQKSAATRLKGRASVLKAEIKLDGGRGGDTSAKEAELAKTEQRAENATSSQLKTLADAGRTISEAAEAEQNPETAAAAQNAEKTAAKHEEENKAAERDEEKNRKNNPAGNRTENQKGDTEGSSQKRIDLRL